MKNDKMLWAFLGFAGGYFLTSFFKNRQCEKKIASLPPLENGWSLTDNRPRLDGAYTEYIPAQNYPGTRFSNKPIVTRQGLDVMNLNKCNGTLGCASGCGVNCKCNVY